MSKITDHKLLVAIFKKDVATLSQGLQSTVLRIHQYRVRTIYKPEPDLFIADWLSRQNHKEKKDAEMPGIQLNIDAIQTTTNIPGCKTVHELQQVMSHVEHLQCLNDHIIQGWPQSRGQIPQDMRI